MQYHILITIPIYILLHAGLAGIFRKAGEDAWKAFVPVFNIMTWLKLVGRPNWWLVWFLIPVINFIMGIGLILDLVRSFGKHKFADQLPAVLFPYFYFIYLGFVDKSEYEGKWVELAETKEVPKSSLREWADAILFAGTAALVIRIFLIEAFMIPTTSMEGSLLAGDFLFVSKFHYGVRLPMAPLSVPFVHNTLPLTSSTKSYLNWLEFPYSRLPGLKDIQRNEAVVFNYPDDDRNPDVEDLGKIEITSMKQNYIKRCVAIPGDTLEIRSRQIYINGEKGWNPEFMQTSYKVSGLTRKVLDSEGFRNNFEQLEGGGLAKQYAPDQNNNIEPYMMLVPPGIVRGELDTCTQWKVHMNETKLAELKQNYPEVVIVPEEDVVPNFRPTKIFVNDALRLLRQGGLKYNLFPKVMGLNGWTKDNFGPIYIPKRGETIQLDPRSLLIYEKVIDVYEDHDVDFKAGQVIIDGQVATEYTFEKDYYWMMGDNRHASLDSRYWGFVPDDHIIGRPWFVLFSWEGGPRWDRFFQPVSKWEE
ncbi:MAG: signal peptidase I [Bacteroidota bacterium]